MIAVIAFLGFGVVMVIINRALRAKEAAGDFDPQSPSSAARPGVRLLFDFSDDGWRTDGISQRPVPRELMNRG